MVDVPTQKKISSMGGGYPCRMVDFPVLSYSMVDVYAPVDIYGPASSARLNYSVQVIKKGYMKIQRHFGSNRDYWFVLTYRTLAWFKDENVNCKVLGDKLEK